MSLITDRDLLLVDPGIFIDAGAAATTLLTAADGGVSGATLTSASSDFVAANIEAQHVVVVGDEALEIVQRVAATQLTVSRPRANVTDDAIEPAPGSGQTFAVRTFSRLIDQCQADMLRALGIDAHHPEQPLTIDDVLNSDDLARLLTLRVFEQSYALASATEPDDVALAARAEVYAAFARRVAAITAAVIDLDGDGVPDGLRVMQVATLVRS